MTATQNNAARLGRGHRVGGRLPGTMYGSAARAYKARTDKQSNWLGEDWLPTLLAAAGDPDVKQKLLSGMNTRIKYRFTWTATTS